MFSIFIFHSGCSSPSVVVPSLWPRQREKRSIRKCDFQLARRDIASLPVLGLIYSLPQPSGAIHRQGAGPAAVFSPPLFSSFQRKRWRSQPSPAGGLSPARAASAKCQAHTPPENPSVRFLTHWSAWLFFPLNPPHTSLPSECAHFYPTMKARLLQPERNATVGKLHNGRIISRRKYFHGCQGKTDLVLFFH